MGVPAKLVVATGVAVIGVGAAVYSAVSFSGRKWSSAPAGAGMMGPAAGAPRGGPGPMTGGMPPELASGTAIAGPGGMTVRFPAGTAERAGLSEEAFAAKVKGLLDQGVPPRELGTAMGLSGVSMGVTTGGGPGGVGGPGGGEYEPPLAGPFAFAKLDSAEGAERAGHEVEDAVERAAAGVAGVQAGDASRLASASRLALVGAARGRADFAAAVRQLGGVLDEQGNVTGSAAGIADVLEGAAIDISNLRIRAVGDEEEAIPMPRLRQSEGSGGGGGFQMSMRLMRVGGPGGPGGPGAPGGAGGELATMEMPVGDVWPEAREAWEEGDAAVEVKCPVRLKDMKVKDGWSEVGVVMVRDRGKWQPVKYVLYVHDGEAARGFARTMAEAARARRATGG